MLEERAGARESCDLRNESWVLALEDPPSLKLRRGEEVGRRRAEVRGRRPEGGEKVRRPEAAATEDKKR